jgi:ribosomal protein S18 acetylase RimI-like enzyme
MTYTIRATTEDDWQDYRAVRLAALADTPRAFVTTLEQASAYDEAEWRNRAAGRHHLGVPTASILAYDGERPVGMLGGGLLEPHQVLMWAVWVAPEHRGSGVAEQLIEALERWARDEAGADEVMLEVNEENARARRFYERVGYRVNGNRQPYPNDPSVDELEMVKPLR